MSAQQFQHLWTLNIKIQTEVSGSNHKILYIMFSWIQFLLISVQESAVVQEWDQTAAQFANMRAVE